MTTCIDHHDWPTALLTLNLCVGITVSYLPQHFRIIKKKTSEGFSPYFLLLGSTSSAAGMMNMFVMQWEIMKCCKTVSAGLCLESVGGIIMVGIQWFMFAVILVLYMIYFPQHLKYVEAVDDDENTGRVGPIKEKKVKTETWHLSIIVSWIVFLHLLFITVTTFILLGSQEASPEPGMPRQLSRWATFLGVSSAGLAVCQYAPQLVHTYKMGLVGALSIPMMMLQTPGTVFMVISIMLRPGTNWTSWITFATTCVMQGSLLCMCIIFRIRQNKAGIDDFGHPVLPAGVVLVEGEETLAPGEDTPLLTSSNTATAPKKGSEGGWRKRFGW